MPNQILVLISEEYGYQHWFAVYNQRVYEQVKNRWQTMRNLNCIVPVTLIFPGAKQYLDRDPPICKTEMADMTVSHAHVHQCDDSAFDACPKFNIPDDGEDFVINDTVFTDAELMALRDKERDESDVYLRQTYPEYFASAAGAESEAGQ